MIDFLTIITNFSMTDTCLISASTILALDGLRGQAIYLALRIVLLEICQVICDGTIFYLPAPLNFESVPQE